MQNPFPGIDPFVEASGRWPDFHVTFMGAWREAIAARLPDDYVACLEEQLTIVEYEEERQRRRAPDITISQSMSRSRSETSAEQVATLERVDLEPEVSSILIEEEIRQSYIQILHLPDHRLVAVLELLSPTNKVGDGRAQYLAKRQQVLLSDAHLVELDLLMSGKRLPLKPARPGHFQAIVSRTGQRPGCQVYSWNLNRLMPSLPVPLISPDPDVVVPLGDVLATTYQRGRYDKMINYESHLELPLADDDRGWVKEQVAKGAR